jgi:hypothetical protein
MEHPPAQFLGPDCKRRRFVVKTQPLASELFTQNPVLFLKIVDGILLPLVNQPAREIRSRRNGSNASLMLAS